MFSINGKHYQAQFHNKKLAKKRKSQIIIEKLIHLFFLLILSSIHFLKVKFNIGLYNFIIKLSYNE